MKDTYTFIALFTYEENSISIDFPDLPGCLPCAGKNDTNMALKNAREALGLHIWGMEQDGEEIPAPSDMMDLNLKPGQVPVMVEVFMPPVRKRLGKTE